MLCFLKPKAQKLSIYNICKAENSQLNDLAPRTLTENQIKRCAKPPNGFFKNRSCSRKPALDPTSISFSGLVYSHQCAFSVSIFACLLYAFRLRIQSIFVCRNKSLQNTDGCHRSHDDYRPNQKLISWRVKTSAKIPC